MHRQFPYQQRRKKIRERICRIANGKPGTKLLMKLTAPQQRQEWYSQAATAYRWARPQYPPAMVDSVITQANLRANSSLLEIGCGPGIATAAFAAKGFSIVGVEPSLAACKLAHKSCGYSDRISIVNSTF